MKYSPCLREESDLEETFFPQSDLTVSFPAAARATSGWGEELRAGTAVLPGSCLSFLKIMKSSTYKGLVTSQEE